MRQRVELSNRPFSQAAKGVYMMIIFDSRLYDFGLDGLEVEFELVRVFMKENNHQSSIEKEKEMKRKRI